MHSSSAILTRVVSHATSSDPFLNSRLMVRIVYTSMVLLMLDIILLVQAMLVTILTIINEYPGLIIVIKCSPHVAFSMISW